MSIIDDIKTLFRAKKEIDIKVETNFKDPLKLRYGSFVEFDKVAFDMIKDRSNFGDAPEDQKVAALGKVDLGQGVKLQRYYFDDDETWLQINTQGDDGDAGIEEMILWKYYKTDSPTSRAELNALIGENSGVGLPTIKLDGKTYDRVWGTGAAYSEMVAFTEEVHVDKDDVVDYTVNHRCMLYRREIEDSARIEFYLISAEENDGTNVVHSVGISITTEDLKNF